jgi:hypothetical protein
MTAQERWYNQDGLTVRFGARPTDEDENVASQPSTAGKIQEIVLKSRDATDIPIVDATGEDAGEFANSAFIPAFATVIGVRIKSDTGLTSAGAASLLVGAYTIDAVTGQLVAVDVDGFVAAADNALSDLDADGEILELDKSAAAALLGKVTVGSEKVVVALAVDTAVYTAGALTVTLEYTQQG